MFYSLSPPCSIPKELSFPSACCGITEMSKPDSVVLKAHKRPRAEARVESTDVSEPSRPLLNLAVALLDSGLDVLHAHLTMDEQLMHHSALIPGGTLGKHFRHVAETYDAFLTALASDPDTGCPQIDYNAVLPSSRDQVARSLKSCQTAMLKVRDGLVAFGEANDLDILLQLPVEVMAITPTRQEMQSTFGRELWFCSLHAIHHFTMIRVIAVHELVRARRRSLLIKQGLHLPIEFGTAPATIHYRGKAWVAPTVSPPSLFKAKL